MNRAPKPTLKERRIAKANRAVLILASCPEGLVEAVGAAIASPEIADRAADVAADIAREFAARRKGAS